MRDRFIQRIRPGAGAGAVIRQPRVSRRERELRQQRLLYIVLAAAGVIVALTLIGGAAYQYYFYPRQDLASVNGEEIERRDYWKVREFQLTQQVAQLSQQFQFVSAEQQNEIRQRIEMASAELEDLQGAPVASDTLSTMVDNLVVIQNMDDVGVTVSDEDIDSFIQEQFAPVPLSTPTPTPTVEPTAAAWATATAEVRNAEATQTAEASATAAQQTATALGTPPATETETPEAGTPEAAEAESDEVGTDEVDGTAEAEVGGTPEGDEAGTPDPAATDAAGTPEAGAGTPEAAESPTPTATPNAEEAIATSEANFEDFAESFLEPADMSVDDYERLIVLPALARERVREALVNELPARAEQVNAAHILVATEEAANEVRERMDTEDFAAVAREVSTDTATAGTGGQLGWFPRGLMPDTFDEVAFGLEPGEISDPVRTDFGWHIIQVLEKEEDRPISIATLQTLRSEVFDEWIDQKRAASEIETDILLPDLDPATQNLDVPQTFQAPPDAPVPPTPTPLPTPTPDPNSTPDAGGAESTAAPEATPSE